ncbi:diguanylate cyclase/phosphodiesterase domain 2 (EAL) [Vibrio ichthyoenteri ATCC 700023]|uniref:Diguanylate cyclase/phosphodiesterase domain 2 (EAL) n=1 Tax=Vibrio ichthyoenteri ATCC 700023 TaxID=870968 RepID=F9S349_9VIBR|nr:EAL domain-containing protein [Vibrio ichthyoenteri]EGU38260.1 diguanylate cyclase/phosphodiesterase domain 2 (EAL) [Vibrio ichthyoenteri ATCC 700023]
MILSSQHQFQKCLSFTDERQFVATYKELKLRSVYQPIFNKCNKTVGVEALVRIQNGTQQNVRPDEFFHSKSVTLEDKINVERLSRVIHIRNFSNSKYRDLNLFLNVLPSACEFFALEDIRIDLLSQRLKSLDIKNDQVVMEVVELDSTNDHFLKVAMDRLAKNGYKIAVDDFGMEASNHQRVELLKPSIIKIDRSLMLDYMHGITEPIINGINLARRINAKVVVEGIETREQYEAMKKLDVDYYQGYFLAMPQPIDAIETEANSY